jgi:hypothetical protein
MVRPQRAIISSQHVKHPSEHIEEEATAALCQSFDRGSRNIGMQVLPGYARYADIYQDLRSFVDLAAQTWPSSRHNGSAKAKKVETHR